MILREMTHADVATIQGALVECGAFNDDEVRGAVEMIDAGLRGDYMLPPVEIDGVARGYACVGKATLTQASWYVYWICIAPAHQRTGAGRSLQAHIEKIVRAAGGERLVLETSGRPDYERARRFYEAAGFHAVGRIPNFYKTGDDCVVYCKELV